MITGALHAGIRLASMVRAPLRFDPYMHDPQHWGVSLAQSAELIIPCLDAVGASSVAEIGAFAGDLTTVLVQWAGAAGAHVIAIDPSPQESLTALANDTPILDLVRKPSLEALSEISIPDALIIDGDHNYYMVSEEARLIWERAPDDRLPLLMFHDVGWPHGRRDDYFAVEVVPEDFRQPLAGPSRGIVPGDAGVRPDGLPYPRSAAHEGGARNGVLTAVEDFVAAHEELRLVVVPAFFGLGVVWHRRAPWARDVEAILGPWDRHPILERLEANRLQHLSERHALAVEHWKLQDKLALQEAVLRRLLHSSAFAVAERLSRLRLRAGIAIHEDSVGKDQIRRVLES
jgi:Methyltransferase domain